MPSFLTVFIPTKVNSPIQVVAETEQQARANASNAILDKVAAPETLVYYLTDGGEFPPVVEENQVPVLVAGADGHFYVGNESPNPSVSIVPFNPSYDQDFALVDPGNAKIVLVNGTTSPSIVQTFSDIASAESFLLSNFPQNTVYKGSGQVFSPGVVPPQVILIVDGILCKGIYREQDLNLQPVI